MDRERLLRELPHLLVIVTLVLVAIPVVQLVLPDSWSFWGGLAVAVLVGVLYRPVVTRLGYAPEHWE